MTTIGCCFNYPQCRIKFHYDVNDENAVFVYFPQSKYMPQLPYIIMAVDAFVAGVLCLLLPETNKAPTAETLRGADSNGMTALSLLGDKREDEEEDPEKMTVV